MAARFWNKQNASANWNATAPTNWGSASGVADGASVPGASDDVTFDGAGANGNNASTISISVTVLSLTFTAGYTNTVTLNVSQNLTIAGSLTDNTAHNWTVNSVGAGALTISAASTITSGGKTWPGNVTFSGANTKTLSGNWTISGALTISAATTVNSAILTCAGLTHSSGAVGGTTAFVLTGGTWTGSSALQNNLTFAGNVTISTATYNTGTITYSSGTITASGTLTVAASTTWDTAGMSFNNITFSVSGTQTINSLLTANGTMQINAGAAITFAGTSGFYVNSFSAVNTTAATHTFKNGVTYTIYGFFLSYLAPNSGGNIFTSDDGTLRTNIVLLNSVSQSLTNGRFTRVDASAGRAIWTLNGTVTDCLNIFTITNLSFVTGKSQVIQGMSNF